MGIIHPRGCLSVGTHTGIATVLRQAQEGNTSVQRKSPTQSHHPQVLSPWSPHLSAPTPHSQTHRVLGHLSENLEVYPSDHSIFQQIRQVHPYSDGSPPLTPIISCPSLNSSCQHAGVSRLELTSQLSLGKLFDLPEPQFSHL